MAAFADDFPAAGKLVLRQCSHNKLPAFANDFSAARKLAALVGPTILT